jgi:hypothetical protein
MRRRFPSCSPQAVRAGLELPPALKSLPHLVTIDGADSRAGPEVLCDGAIGRRNRWAYQGCDAAALRCSRCHGLVGVLAHY